MQLTARVEAWRAGGETVRFRDREIFVRRRGGEGPPLLLLHGFPSSSFDWRRMLDALPRRAALAFDFLGFGLSEKPGDHIYSLAWQADLVEELVARYIEEPFLIVAHDMGTSVATELMARAVEGRGRIEAVGALLFNGSIVLERASPTIGQRLLRSPCGPVLARLSSAWFFRNQLGSTFSQRHPLTREEADDQWSLYRNRHGNRNAHRLIHYMGERERLTERWHGAIRDWAEPLSFAWAMGDPVATPAVLGALRELRPAAPVTELVELGHYPQIEEPCAIARIVETTLARIG